MTIKEVQRAVGALMTSDAKFIEAMENPSKFLTGFDLSSREFTAFLTCLTNAANLPGEKIIKLEGVAQCLQRNIPGLNV